MSNGNDFPPQIRVAKLFEKRSRTGNVYYSGAAARRKQSSPPGASMPALA